MPPNWNSPSKRPKIKREMSGTKCPYTSVYSSICVQIGELQGLLNAAAAPKMRHKSACKYVAVKNEQSAPQWRMWCDDKYQEIQGRSWRLSLVTLLSASRPWARLIHLLPKLKKYLPRSRINESLYKDDYTLRKYASNELNFLTTVKEQLDKVRQ